MRALLGRLGDAWRALLPAAAGSNPAPAALGRAVPPAADPVQTLAAAIAALPYPRVEVPGEEALATWERLRAAGDGWPVIVGGDEQLIGLVGLRRDLYRDSRATLARADRLTHPQGLQQLHREQAAKLGGGPFDPPPESGEWPDDLVRSSGPTVLRDMRQQWHARVHVLVLPTAEGAAVPALLGWGGWNACPPPEYHVAALRAWRAAYGAELVALGPDTLELRVARRPETRDAALALAHEHYEYCNDTVDQGFGDMAPFAAALLQDDWWHFWWD